MQKSLDSGKEIIDCFWFCPALLLSNSFIYIVCWAIKTSSNPLRMLHRRICTYRMSTLTCTYIIHHSIRCWRWGMRWGQRINPTNGSGRYVRKKRAHFPTNHLPIISPGPLKMISKQIRAACRDGSWINNDNERKARFSISRRSFPTSCPPLWSGLKFTHPLSYILTYMTYSLTP